MTLFFNSKASIDGGRPIETESSIGMSPDFARVMDWSSDMSRESKAALMARLLFTIDPEKNFNFK